MQSFHQNRRHLTRYLAMLLLAALVVLAAPPRARAAVVYPNTIASTGDSITRAFNTGLFPFTDATSNSWSTGSSSTVNSLARRIAANNPAFRASYNDARTGAKMGELATQFNTVKTQAPEYVTVLMGANDVCASSEAGMTDVASFRGQFQTALASLVTALPNTRVYVVSIPNIYNLWSVLRTKSAARSAWSAYSICQSMLKNPSSTLQADADRRARVLQRNIDFNTQLAQVCAQYSQCRFDNNAMFNTAFVASDISTRDYFHPSVAGQTKLAAVAWGASGLAP